MPPPAPPPMPERVKSCEWTPKLLAPYSSACCRDSSALSERGLKFCGTNAMVGSLHIGLFLGVLELISKFDPSLANHISTYARKGKGHTCHLSKNTCNVLTELLENTWIVSVMSFFSVCQFSTWCFACQSTCVLQLDMGVETIFSRWGKK